SLINYFLFQAEDGIRDLIVTGVQTCALPIWTGGVWSQQQQLTATGGAAGDRFGSSVALSSNGNTALVGAFFDDVGANVDQGSAEIGRAARRERGTEILVAVRVARARKRRTSR